MKKLFTIKYLPLLAGLLLSWGNSNAGQLQPTAYVFEPQDLQRVAASGMPFAIIQPPMQPKAHVSAGSLLGSAANLALLVQAPQIIGTMILPRLAKAWLGEEYVENLKKANQAFIDGKTDELSKDGSSCTRSLAVLLLSRALMTDLPLILLGWKMAWYYGLAAAGYTGYQYITKLALPYILGARNSTDGRETILANMVKQEEDSSFRDFLAPDTKTPVDHLLRLDAPENPALPEAKIINEEIDKNNNLFEEEKKEANNNEKNINSDNLFNDNEEEEEKKEDNNNEGSN